jgi:hypothetical protein
MEQIVPADEQQWRTLAGVDVAFRLRRLLHLTYRYQTQLNQSGLASAVNRQIETLEIMRSALEAAVEQVAVECFGMAGDKLTSPLDATWAGEVWAQVFDRVNAVANVQGPSRHRRGTELHLTAVEDDTEKTEKDELMAFALRVSTTSKSPASNLQAQLTTTSFFAQSDTFERQLLSSDPTLASAYANYERVDAILYPIEAVSGLRSYDVVSLARVSPRDAQIGLARKDMSQKVTGTRYGHFAAFFKRSWRSNDILWGRLDGACELVDVLLRQDRLHELFGNPTLDAGLQAELVITIADIEADAKALPLPQSDRSKLFQWLRRLTSIDAEARKLALAEFEASKRKSSPADGPLTWLVLGAQLEALSSGLSDVFADNHCERLEYEDPSAGSLVAPKGEKLAREELKDVGATPDQLIKFFRYKYSVGSEELSNIPPLVVADWIARALILTRNSLLVSAGKRADGVRSHILFQMFFGWPLRALAALSSLLRGAPHWLAAFTLSALAYIVLCGVVLALFYEDLNKSEHSAMAQALFIGCPLLLSLFLWFVARLRGPGGWSTKLIRIGAGIVGLGLLLSLVPVLYSTLEINPANSCSALPEQLTDACERVWTPELSEFAPWLVLCAAILGILSLLGAFGWIGRKLVKIETRAVAWYRRRKASRAIRWE